MPFDKDEAKELIALMREDQQQKKNKQTPAIAIAIGLTIALGGNFIGWFATKSTSDVENVTRINQTLEFMQQQQNQIDEGLKGDIKELKEVLEGSIEKINKRLDDQFTREDFEREMIYRDQDMKRIQNQVEEIFDKIDEID